MVWRKINSPSCSVKTSFFSSAVESSRFSSVSPSLPSSSSSSEFLSSSSCDPNGLDVIPPIGFINFGAEEITSTFEASAPNPEEPYVPKPPPNPEDFLLAPLNPPAPNGLEELDCDRTLKGDADANGDEDVEDSAPNFEFLNRSDVLVPGPKSGLVPAPAVAKGDFTDVFANPLPEGSCCGLLASYREFC